LQAQKEEKDMAAEVVGEVWSWVLAECTDPPSFRRGREEDNLLS